MPSRFCYRRSEMQENRLQKGAGVHTLGARKKPNPWRKAAPFAVFNSVAPAAVPPARLGGAKCGTCGRGWRSVRVWGAARALGGLCWALGVGLMALLVAENAQIARFRTFLERHRTSLL